MSMITYLQTRLTKRRRPSQTISGRRHLGSRLQQLRLDPQLANIALRLRDPLYPLATRPHACVRSSKHHFRSDNPDSYRTLARRDRFCQTRARCHLRDKQHSKGRDLGHNFNASAQAVKARRRKQQTGIRHASASRTRRLNNGPGREDACFARCRRLVSAFTERLLLAHATRTHGAARLADRYVQQSAHRRRG